MENVLKKEKVYVSYYPKKQEVVSLYGTYSEVKPTTPVIEEQKTPAEEDTHHEKIFKSTRTNNQYRSVED